MANIEVCKGVEVCEGLLVEARECGEKNDGAVYGQPTIIPPLFERAVAISQQMTCRKE